MISDIIKLFTFPFQLLSVFVQAICKILLIILQETSKNQKTKKISNKKFESQLKDSIIKTSKSDYKKISSNTKEKVYSVSAKDRTTAIMLCCLGFIGIAGLHRMYVGKWGMGVLYSFTAGLFLIGTFYDLYELINESFKDCDGFPLFAESSIKKDYKRREPNDNTNMGVKILCGLFPVYQGFMLLIFILSVSTK